MLTHLTCQPTPLSLSLTGGPRSLGPSPSSCTGLESLRCHWPSLACQAFVRGLPCVVVLTRVVGYPAGRDAPRFPSTVCCCPFRSLFPCPRRHARVHFVCVARRPSRSLSVACPSLPQHMLSSPIPARILLMCCDSMGQAIPNLWPHLTEPEPIRVPYNRHLGMHAQPSPLARRPPSRCVPPPSLAPRAKRPFASMPVSAA
jgi:hypothetical protein